MLRFKNRFVVLKDPKLAAHVVVIGLVVRTGLVLAIRVRRGLYPDVLGIVEFAWKINAAAKDVLEVCMERLRQTRQMGKYDARGF